MGIDHNLGENYSRYTVIDQAIAMHEWREATDRVTREALKSTGTSSESTSRLNTT